MIKPPIIIPERAIDLNQRIVLMCAGYVAGNKPKYVCARYAGVHGGHDPIELPAFVGAKVGFISAYERAMAWYKVDIGLARVDGLPGANGKGMKRYQAFVARALAAGFVIEWQGPPGRYYKDRAGLERSLVPTIEPARPLAYVDD